MSAGGGRCQDQRQVEGLAADRELMPPYPGIEGSESCLDWEIDLPLASLAMVVNPAAGLATDVIDMADIRQASRNAMAKAAVLVRAFLEGFQGLE